MLDHTTKLQFVVKRPAPEIRSYSIDFSKNLTEIQNVVSVIVEDYLKIGTSPLDVTNITFDATKVYFILSGGEDLEEYILRLHIVDTSGNNIVEPVLVKLRENGLY